MRNLGFRRGMGLLCALFVAWPGGLLARDDGADDVSEETIQQGREIFTTSSQPPCRLCHTLADADAEGRIGPNLDQMRPDADKVRTVIEDGPGSMPAYGDRLSDEEIDAVAAYVAAVAGQ